MSRVCGTAMHRYLRLVRPRAVLPRVRFLPLVVSIDPSSRGLSTKRWDSKRLHKESMPETENILLAQLSANGNGDNDNGANALNGQVVETKMGFARVAGVSEASLASLVQFESGLEGYVVSLETSTVGVALLGGIEAATVGVSVGDGLAHPPTPLSFPVGHSMLGRVVDPLGRERFPDAAATSFLEDNSLSYAPTLNGGRGVPRIVERATIQTPFYTGCKFIDLLHPLGHGQRLAFRGCKGTGKTKSALQIIRNVKNGTGPQTKCVYVAMGHSEAQLKTIVHELDREGALDYTCVVASFTDDCAGQTYLAPYSGSRLAEHLRDQGEHVLVVYDELGSHALSVKSIAAMTNAPFVPTNLHANLLERGAQMRKGGGALTALALLDTPSRSPHFVETESETSIWHVAEALGSAVDDAIDFEDKMAKRGQWPAVSMFDHGTKLASCQQAALQSMVRTLHRLLIDARLAENASARMKEFGIDPLDEGRVEVVEKVLEKEKIEMLFLNHANEYTPFARLVLSVYVSVHGFLGNIPLPSIVEFEDYLWNEALKAGDLVEDLEHLRHDEPLSSEMLSLMREQIEAVVQRFVEIDDDV